MVEAPYILRCPADGSQLLPNAMGPETAPWRCDECRTSWWAAELSTGALQAFRRECYDFGHANTKAHKSIREAVRVEAELARNRGTSVRHDQLALIHPDVHRGILNRFKLSSAFADQLRAHLEASEA